jgi:hypothetical protein
MTTPPAGPTLYFALYLDVVRYPVTRDDEAPVWKTNPNGWIGRRQWIVLPRRPGSEMFLVFFREQNAPAHRAVWRSTRRGDLGPIELDWSQQAEMPFRVGHEPVVVELSYEELLKYTEDGGRTPWRVIERARHYTQRAATHWGGYVI